MQRFQLLSNADRGSANIGDLGLQIGERATNSLLSGFPFSAGNTHVKAAVELAQAFPVFPLRLPYICFHAFSPLGNLLTKGEQRVKGRRECLQEGFGIECTWVCLAVAYERLAQGPNEVFRRIVGLVSAQCTSLMRTVITSNVDSCSARLIAGS